MSSRFEFALAGPADDPLLRQGMAEVSMDGPVSISFRREPSYFAGCRVQGERAQVVKCTDSSDGSLVGMGSRLQTMLHVNGVPRRLGYLADLRVRPPYRRGTLLARGYRHLRAMHRADPVPFYLTVIFGGNDAATQNLVGGRAGLPIYTPQGRILTPALHLDFARPPIAVEGVRFERAAEADWTDLRAFLRAEAARKQFSPVYAEAEFAPGGRLADLRASDFFVARNADGILACLAAWDQSALRQTHVERYSKGLRIARPFYNLASAVTPIKPLPPAGSRLPYVYLCCIAVAHDDVKVLSGLVRRAYNTLRVGAWHHAIGGLHERDPLARVLGEYRRIEAAGHLFSVHYAEDGDPSAHLDARVPYFEMALA